MGTPWRPLIDVGDMALAIEWAIGRSPEHGGAHLVVNVGSDDRNYRIRDLADAVAHAVPGVTVRVNAAAPPDHRSYRVDFSRFRSLAPDHQPHVDLAASIANLVVGLRAIRFADRNFRDSPLVRLKMLANHLECGRLSPDLRWRR